MFGPTGGYLASYMIAAAIVGHAVDRGLGRNPFKLFGAMLAAEVVILAMGAAWLAYLLGAEKALAFGVGPFIVTDLVNEYFGRPGIRYGRQPAGWRRSCGSA